jgi:hypothetical protein
MLATPSFEMVLTQPIARGMMPDQQFVRRCGIQVGGVDDRVRSRRSTVCAEVATAARGLPSGCRRAGRAASSGDRHSAVRVVIRKGRNRFTSFAEPVLTRVRRPVTFIGRGRPGRRQRRTPTSPTPGS